MLAGRTAYVAIGAEPRRGLICVLLMTIRVRLLLMMMRVEGQTDQGVEFSGLAKEVQTVMRLLLGHKVCIRIVPDEILC